MQLKQLRNFITVVEEGSFSQAARVLYIAQSSLSQSIANLEQELGFPLLLRGHDGVTLTQFGRMVYDDVKDLLARLDGQTARWNAFIAQHNGLRGNLRLSSVSSVHPILARQVLPQLSHSWPNLRCSLQEARSDSTLAFSWVGKIDLSLYTFPDFRREELAAAAQARGLEVLPLCGDSYRIAVAADGPLGALEDLSPADAARLPLACYAGGDDVAAAFFDRFFDRSLALEFNSFEKIVDAAASGQAAAVLPAAATGASLALTSRRPPLRFLTVGGFSLPFTHYMLTRREDAALPGLEQVKQTVRAVFDSLGK